MKYEKDVNGHNINSIHMEKNVNTEFIVSWFQINDEKKRNVE